MKVLNFILAAMFLGFAAVQVNDNDAILWILIYGLMAAVCVMAMFKFYIKWLIGLMAFGFIVYGAFLLPGAWQWATSDHPILLFDNIAKMENTHIEIAREFLGIVINVAVLAWYGYQSFKA